MKIRLCTLTWNEEKFLPYFLDYYSTFCDKIVIFDNYSTDKTDEIVKRYDKVELRRYSSGNQISDSLYLSLKNNAYKKDREDYDWQIVVDADEILFHPHIRELLASYMEQGITLPQTRGFQMISQVFPSDLSQPIYKSVNCGIYNPSYSKFVVFNPKSVTINYNTGCHACSPAGNVKKSKVCDLKLLHYKFLSYDYLLTRYNQYKQRLSDENKDNKWGHQYLMNKSQLYREFNTYLHKARPVI